VADDVLLYRIIRKGGLPTRIGDHVRFRAASVFLWPEPGSTTVPPDMELEGKVIGFSDSGSEPRVFAVVEVGETQSVVVRVSELEIVGLGAK